MSARKCRWGFLSTAAIAKKHWHAISLAENATLTAVASRRIETADAFIESCSAQIPVADVPTAIGGYENLISRDDIDAVYVPLPTGLRKEWVIKAAETGKHVLCEKPCAIDADDLQDMIAACRKNNVQFMDGVMLMHTDRLKRMRKIVDEETGRLRRVHSHLTFCGDDQFCNHNIRTLSQLEPHGCLGDLGWYNIRIALWAANWELPIEVKAESLNELKREGSHASVPMSFAGDFHFANGASAGFYCSFEDHDQQWAVIGGDKGFVQVQDFVLPFAESTLNFSLGKPNFEIENCVFNMRENCTSYKCDESGNNAIDAQETKLIQKFSEIVISGSRESFWEDVALRTQRVLDACFESAKSGGTKVRIAKS